MQHNEFGFDFNEVMGMNMAECREQMDCRAFDEEMKSLKFPTNSQILFTSVEDFINRGSEVSPVIWNKLAARVPARRAVYGFDAVSIVDNRLSKIPISDFEVTTLKRALTGMVFDIIPLKKDEVMIVNKLAARQVVKNHPADFDGLAKADCPKWIQNILAARLQSGESLNKHFPDLQYGLLSGYPKNSTANYPKFHALRMKYPEFAVALSDFIYNGGNIAKVKKTLDQLQIPDEERSYLNQITSISANCSDKSVLAKSEFMVLSESDLQYAARRQYWLEELDRIFEPVLIR